LASFSVSVSYPPFSCHPPAPTHLYLLSLHDALPIFRFAAVKVLVLHPQHRGFRVISGLLGGEHRHGKQLLVEALVVLIGDLFARDRKSTRLNSSHVSISYAVFCLKKKNHVLRNQKEV